MIREDRFDYIKDMDWDTLNFCEGEIIERGRLDIMFQKPMSYEKSFLETSMWLAGSLPAPQSKMIRKLYVVYGGRNNREDILDFRDNTRYNLVIGQKFYDSAPMARFQFFNNSLEELEKLLEKVKIAKELGFNIAGNYVDYEDHPHHILINQYFKFEVATEKRWKVRKDFKVVVMLEGEKQRSVC